MGVVVMDNTRRAEFAKRERQRLDDVATVSAICNRVARMLGTLDREGLQRDLAIVQKHCPLDLQALAGAPDWMFIDELTTIIEATDRTTESLSGSFRSRFLREVRADEEVGA